MQYIENSNELVFENRHAALGVIESLLEEGYVMMISKEDKYTVINFNWCSNDADKNDFVFMTRETFDNKLYKGI